MSKCAEHPQKKNLYCRECVESLKDTAKDRQKEDCEECGLVRRQDVVDLINQRIKYHEKESGERHGRHRFAISVLKKLRSEVFASE